MTTKNKRIYAKDLKPGDLIFSYRTQQAMFILGSMPFLNSLNENKIQLTWAPLTGKGEVFSVDVGQYNEYISL